MKLTVPQKTLAKTLASAARIVERKSTVPILSHLLLEAGDGLTLKGTDLDVAIETNLSADVARRGACCVPAAMLADIVRKFDEKAEVSMELDESQLVVRAGRSRFKLSSLPAQDFPETGAKDHSHRFSVPTAALATMIDKTAFAISTEETRYYLNGVYFHRVEGESGPRLRGVATDGHKLSRFDMLDAECSDGMPGVIIPRKTIDVLARMTKEAGVETIPIDLSDREIRFTLGPTRLASKLIDGTFPDYARVIPSSPPHHATIDGEALAQAVARVATISSERGRAVKFAFSDRGPLTLSISNPETGEARDEVEVEWDGPDLEVGFNAAYAQTVLAALGPGNIVLKLSDPGSPCVLTHTDDANTLIVLMPMRV